MLLPLNQKAFTLIELLVVMSIVGIISAVGFPAFAAMQKNISLKNYTKEIVSNLRHAHNLAVASQDGENHGIYFLEKEYGTCEQNCTIHTAAYDIANGVEVLQGSGDSVIFDRLTGNTSAQTIVVGFDGGKQNTIVIDASGRITTLY